MAIDNFLLFMAWFTLNWREIIDLIKYINIRYGGIS